MFNIPAEVTALVAARAELLASDDYSPAFTRALNRIEAQLDKYDWLDVMRAEKALKTERETARVTTAA